MWGISVSGRLVSKRWKKHQKCTAPLENREKSGKKSWLVYSLAPFLTVNLYGSAWISNKWEVFLVGNGTRTILIIILIQFYPWPPHNFGSFFVSGSREVDSLQRTKGTSLANQSARWPKGTAHETPTAITTGRLPYYAGLARRAARGPANMVCKGWPIANHIECSAKGPYLEGVESPFF